MKIEIRWTKKSNTRKENVQMDPAAEEQEQVLTSTNKDKNLSRRRVSFRLWEFKILNVTIIELTSNEESKEAKQKRRHSNLNKREMKGKIEHHQVH